MTGPAGTSELARRSMLFVPGLNARAIEKARGLPADGIILDLEDSVAEAQKDLARRQVADAIRAGGFAAGEILVRTNAVGSAAFADDVAAALAGGADGIVLPKVETVDALERAAETSQANGRLSLWAMIETPRAVLDIAAIAAAAQTLPLAGLIVGPNDLLRTTGVSAAGDRQFLVPWLMQIVLAAKAFGLTVLDGVYNAYQDDDGMARECVQAARMGFDGKTLIHPRQIAHANAAFSPPPDEIAWAEAVLAAFADPATHDENVLSVAGAMVERLHIPVAQAILRRAGLAGRP